MILGEYLQMKYGTQKKKQLIMQREIILAMKSVFGEWEESGIF